MEDSQGSLTQRRYRTALNLFLNSHYSVQHNIKKKSAENLEINHPILGDTVLFMLCDNVQPKICSVKKKVVLTINRD